MRGPATARVLTLPTRRPWTVFCTCALLAVLGGWLATRLELRTRFDQLLPDHQPSVAELRRVQEHIAASQHVFIVLEGGDPRALRDLGDALVPRLRALGAPWVTSAQDGVQESQAFLRPRAALFASIEDLQKLNDDVQARWDWEVGRSTDSNLDDDPPPEIHADAIRARFGISRQERFPDGYFQSPDGRALVVVARSAVGAGELDRAHEALRRIKGVVHEVATGDRFGSVSVGYAGDLVTALSEYGAVRTDLASVGARGVGLVLAVVFLFFMRLRVLVAMGFTIAVGLAWTFGLTEIVIGHLNVATGFLFSIVAGNGINFGIIYMARFYEEVRAGHSPARALAVAQSATWPATLTAALAAAASYASLGVTDFRAFKHFALIGSAGMVLCWIATYAMLPGILMLFERARPFARSAAPASANAYEGLRLHGIPYDKPFGFLVSRAPRFLALAGVTLAAGGLLALGPYLRADPMQYDMRKLQNDAGESKEMYRVSALAADVLGTQLEDSMVVLCDRLDQVRALKRALELRRDASPSQDKPFEAAHSLFDFVPESQEQKIDLALALRDRLVRAHDRGIVSEADWADIERSLPPRDLKVWSLDDLPEELARPFTERDGVRGRLVLIEPAAGKSDSDLRYLLRWANSFRETRLPDGSVVRGSGRAVIFADMLEAVQKDMPRAITLSFVMTLFAVVLTFGRGALSAAVIGTLLVGVGWVAAAMAAVHLKIDFFNFVALPITFGIGVDYAVNLVQRYEANPPGGILGVLKSAGGPVILCSLTTMLGYLALLGSMNRAIRGLGLLAVFGEVACLLAAVLVLPAALLVWERGHESARPRVDGRRLEPRVISETKS